MSSSTPDRILYVDDEEALLDITRAFLERAGGITVDTTPSPLEAFRMIMTGRYDAVVSDYQMPEMDGIALLKRIRKAGSRVPFIIFTGRGREEVAIEALNNGADFYLQKGGNPKTQFAELANAVRQLAGRQKAEAAFHKSQETLHKAQSLAHLGSWEFDPGTGRLTWSEETYRILGLNPGEDTPTYEGFLSIVHPDDRVMFDTTYYASIADGKDNYEIEHRIIRADTRELRYLVERCEHQRDESGRVVRSIGMVHDITDRKLAELELLRRHEELQAAYEQLASIEEELRTSFDDLAESQRRLKESERRLADIIEFLPDATFVIDTGGHVIAWNRAIEKMTGVLKAEMLDRGDYAYAVPFYGEARPVLIDYVLRPDRMAGCPYHIRAGNGEVLEGEVALARPGGRDAILMIRASPLYDREGRRAGAIEIVRDITEQKQVEADLRETKEYLENLIDHANAPIVVWNPECIITRFNRAFEHLTGIPADEAIGQNLETLFPEESRNASMGQIRRAMAGKLWEDVEIPIVHRSGSVRTVLWNSANIVGSDGETPVATIAQGQDITIRKQAETELLQKHEELQAAYEQLASIEEELRTSFDDLAESQRQLRQSEERYRRLAENAEDIIYLVEVLPEMRFVYMNPAVTRILGYTPDDYYADAHFMERVIHPDDRSLIASLDGDVIAKGPLTLRWMRKDGGIVWIEHRNIPFFDATGRVVAFEGIGRDVTEAKQEQELLLESKGRVQKKLDSILSPEGNISGLDLADIIDLPVVQALIDDFHTLANIPVVISNARGRVVVGAGWQEICTKYHRVHPDTIRYCVESDTVLSAGIPAGESKIYQCHNGMWDMVTPIIVGDRLLGNLHAGQFFFEDEEPDREVFRSQARRYGYDEEGYLAALRAVPRLDRASVDAAVAFLREFAVLISRLSYANITLARSLAERDALTKSLEETANRLGRTQEIAHIGSWEFDHRTDRLFWSDEVYRILGLDPAKHAPTYERFLSLVHPDDRTAVDTKYLASIADGKDNYEIEHRILRGDTGEVRYVVERCEHQRDKSGRAVRSVGMVHDITERKLAELELLQKHEELQAAYEQLASIEEELRTSFDDLAESQRQLRESEELYRRISESISDVVFVCDFQDTGEYAIGRIAGAVHEITGYTDDEVLAMRCWKHLVHPDDMPIFEREIRSLSPNMSSAAELRIVHRDGSARWIRVSANCTNGQNGGLRLYGGWQDITDQKEAEEALRESEWHFRTLADSGQALIWTSGLDANCDYFNEPWLAFTGRTLEQELGDGWTEGVHPDDLSRCIETYLDAFARRERFSMAYRLRRHDGEYRWIQDDGSPRYDTHGNFLGYIGHCLDVTEQRRMEEALRETAEKMESIFRVAPTGIGVAVDGLFTEVNDRLCEITGYTRDELIGQSVRLFYPSDEEYESAMQEIIAGVGETGTCTLEARSLCKDGGVIIVQLSITPLDSTDISRGTAFTIQDITERKAIEQEIIHHASELARQTNSLTVANRKLNLMNSITRHDILNQLTILLGNLSFAEEAEPGQDVSVFLARVKNAADRIRRQIEFTRDYTDLGDRFPEWQQVSDAIRKEALHGLPVDDEAGNLVIYADPMLAAAFSNLMDNTIRHGESATRVRVWYRPEENGDLTLVWEDDGVGIPAEEKERIFERNVGKNTGLGLFLIREILGITGISITETGEPGKGARFEMLIPHGAYRL